MTLQKVAKLAGVSVSTASKALTNSKEVSAETRLLVQNAAEKLGYYNENKRRRLENRNTDMPTVGIICPEIVSVYYSEIVTLLCRKITERGGSASVYISEFDNENQTDILRRCMAESAIDAVLSLDGENSATQASFSSLPTVYLVRTSDCDCVYNDYENAFFDALSYLKNKGHRRLAFVGEPLTRSKKQNFVSALTRLELPVNEEFLFTEAGRFELSGKKAAEKMLALAPNARPSAVLCAYDEIAYGLINTLRVGGVRIPEDISVIGVNDIAMSKYLQTPLTTVRHDAERLCDEALALLFRQLKNPSVRKNPTQIPIACRLIERDSTAPCASIQE